jgi:pimeloyl-ACP methyl ester carboxylesterase
MTTLVFVHGACVRDADWWWSRMTQPLAKLGVPTVAVALPSCGEIGDTLGDLYDDVQACHEAIAEVDGPVVLCGHSYGGMIITEAGADDRVTQLLYVTSVMPDAGQSQADLIGSEPAPWLQPGEDGTVGVDPDMIREFFLQDCDESTTEQAVSRLTRQSLTPFTQAPRQIAAEAHHVLRLHRGSRHPARGAAPTRQSRYATRRVWRRASPVSFASRRVRRKHRRRDRPQLSKPIGCRLVAEAALSPTAAPRRTSPDPRL